MKLTMFVQIPEAKIAICAWCWANVTVVCVVGVEQMLSQGQCALYC